MIVNVLCVYSVALIVVVRFVKVKVVYILCFYSRRTGARRMIRCTVAWPTMPSTLRSRTKQPAMLPVDWSGVCVHVHGTFFVFLSLCHQCDQRCRMQGEGCRCIISVRRSSEVSNVL